MEVGDTPRLRPALLTLALVTAAAAAGCKGSTGSPSEPPEGKGGSESGMTEAGPDDLASLPYLNITTRSNGHSGDVVSGVLRIDEERVGRGFNLYNNHYRNVAELVDLRGEVVHTWRSTAGQSRIPEEYRWTIPPYLGWHHIEMDPEGNLYVIVGYPPLPYGGVLVALDFQSNPKWELPIGAHHDIALGDEPGEVFTLTFDLVAHEHDDLRFVLEEEKIVRVKDGKVVAALSINELLEADEELAPLLEEKIATLAEGCAEQIGDRDALEATVYRKILYHYLDLYSTGQVLTHEGLEKIPFRDDIAEQLDRLSQLFLAATTSEAKRDEFSDAMGAFATRFIADPPADVKASVDAALEELYGYVDPEKGLTDTSPKALLAMSNYCRANAIHSNTIEVLPRDIPGVAKKGDLLTSFRQLDLIAIVRMSEDGTKGKVVWHYGPDGLSRQHQPALTADDTIIVFDNGVAEKRSRVVEIDPKTDAVVWTYGDGDGEKSYYSWWKGGVEKLPNGNALIANTVTGEVFEVTPDKKIVWYFVAPGDSKSKVTQVYRFMRIAEEVVQKLLPEVGPSL